MNKEKKDEWEILFETTKKETKHVKAASLNKILDKKAVWIKISKNKDIIFLTITEVIIIIYFILALLGVVPFF